MQNFPYTRIGLRIHIHYTDMQLCIMCVCMCVECVSTCTCICVYKYRPTLCGDSQSCRHEAHKSCHVYSACLYLFALVSISVCLPLYLIYPHYRNKSKVFKSQHLKDSRVD